jgi:O-antigen/teichoic acid export membrane protein
MAIPLLFSPTQLGIWNLMNVVLGYAPNAHLGVLHGMNKAIPLLRGQGRAADVDALKDSALWVCIVLGVLAAGGLWLAASGMSAGVRSALRVTSVAAFIQVLYTYQFCLLRGESRFALVSRGIVLGAVLGTVCVLGLALLARNRLVGALVGLAISVAVTTGFWFAGAGHTYARRIHWAWIGRAFRLGLPLMLIGLLDMVFLSADRWVVAGRLGVTATGYYALGIMASGLLGLVPNAFAQVLYPFALTRIGETGDPRSLCSALKGSTTALSAIMLVLISGAALALVPIVQLFLPVYRPSLQVIQILLVGSFFLAFGSIPGQFVIAVDRQRLIPVFQVAGTLSALAVDYMTLRAGWGITGVAIGTVTGYAVYGLGVATVAALYVFPRSRDASWYLVSLLVPLALMVVGLAAAQYLIPSGTSAYTALGFAGARMLLVLVVTLPALWFVARWNDVLAMLPLVSRLRNLWPWGSVP